MKTIYLLRHAKAEKSEGDLSDKERKLVKGGVKDAKAVAKNLRREGVRPERILTSDVPRARETADIFAKKLKFEGLETVIDGKIYSADTADSLLQIIKGLDDKIERVMMVGHDPSLSGLAHLLVPSFSYRLPKAGVLGIECDIEKWADVTSGTNRIQIFLAPMKKGKIKKMEKHIASRLAQKLETAIQDTLNEFDLIADNGMQNTIRKRSRQVAMAFVGMRRVLSFTTLEDISAFLDRKEVEKTKRKTS